MNLMVNVQRIEGAQVPTQMIETSNLFKGRRANIFSCKQNANSRWSAGCTSGINTVYHIKDQSLAAGKVGFVSAESSTPEKHARTFVPVIGTPRCSPHLAAKCKRYCSSSSWYWSLRK